MPGHGEPGHPADPDGVADEQTGYLYFACDYNRHDIICRALRCRTAEPFSGGKTTRRQER